MSSLQKRDLNPTAQSLLSLVIAPDTEDSQRLLSDVATNPGEKVDYIFQSQLGSIIRLQVFWGIQTSLPTLSRCMYA